jgi:hypothetical protein
MHKVVFPLQHLSALHFQLKNERKIAMKGNLFAVDRRGSKIRKLFSSTSVALRRLNFDFDAILTLHQALSFHFTRLI